MTVETHAGKIPSYNACQNTHLCVSRVPESLYTNSVLTQHQKTKAGETPFKCNHCGKPFRQNLYLIGNQRNLRTENPFKSMNEGNGHLQATPSTRGTGWQSNSLFLEEDGNAGNHRADHHTHAVNVRKPLITQTDLRMTQATKPLPSTHCN